MFVLHCKGVLSSIPELGKAFLHGVNMYTRIPSVGQDSPETYEVVNGPKMSLKDVIVSS